MTRPLCAAMLLTLVPFAATADDPKPPDYYPLVEGNKWQYVANVNGTKAEVTTAVTAVKKKKGKVTATISTLSRDGSDIEEEISSDAKGVYRNSISGVKPDRPLTIIKYPIKSGDTWSETLKSSGMDVEVETTVGKQVAVKVPAGTFKTYPVDMTLTIGAQELKVTTWYADGVGIVKQKVTVGELDLTMELKKFTPGEGD